MNRSKMLVGARSPLECRTMSDKAESAAKKEDFHLPVEEINKTIEAEVDISSAIRNHRSTIVCAIVVLLTAIGTDVSSMEEGQVVPVLSTAVAIMIGLTAGCVHSLLSQIRTRNADFAKKYPHWFQKIFDEHFHEAMNQVREDVLLAMRARYIPPKQTGNDEGTPKKK